MPLYRPIYQNDLTGAIGAISRTTLEDVLAWPLANGFYVVGETTQNSVGAFVERTTLRLFSANNDFLGLTEITGRPIVAASPGGGFVVTWTTAQPRTATPGDIFVRWFDAQGNPEGAAQLANAQPDAVDRVAQDAPRVVDLANGTTLVFWSSTAGTRYQIFDSNHAKVGGERAFTGAVLGETLELSDGTFVMVDATAMVQRFSNLGVPLSGASSSGAGAANAQIVDISSGGFAVAWLRGQVVEAQYFTEDGAKLGGVLTLTALPAGQTPDWNVAAVGLSDLAVAWKDGAAVIARVVDRNGQSSSGNFQVNQSADSATFPDVVGFVDGSLEFVYRALNSTGPFTRGIRFAPEDLVGNARIGTVLDDRLFAVDTGVVMEGRGGTDTLVGGAGNDSLDGGSGRDTMSGGAGDDLYFVDESGDTVNELGSQGFDTVVASTSYALTSGSSVERMMTVDQNQTVAINLTGNAAANIILGNAGRNILDGAEGDDELFGLAGNDVLIGGSGRNVLSGGLGDDAYYVTSITDQIVEAANEGADIVRTIFTFTLTAGAWVEILSAADNNAGNLLNLTGNELDNTIWGNANRNGLYGVAGDDYIDGFGGDDEIDGGLGADTMVGGNGNDEYFVDNLNDRTIEAAGQGQDTVRTSISYALLPGVEVELLTTMAAQGTVAINLTGNNFANRVQGNAGANILDGGAGNDTLEGFGGDDVLIGGAGADYMVGGEGNDGYLVDDLADVIVESGGFDIVRSSVSYTLQNGVAVEILSTIDVAQTTAINLNGNEVANTLWGNAGINYLNGGAGDDQLDGFAGNDILTGGTGADTMVGWTGDDVFFVDNETDRVIEFVNEGYDIVRASANYGLTASSYVEALVTIDLGSIATIHLTGNQFGQAVLGNNGFNILSGGGGDDLLDGFAGLNTLIGGAGADSFAFTSALADSSTTINDFNAVDDTILLGAATGQAFAGMSLGALSAAAFMIGAAATTTEQRILYNSTTGALLYDADGTGSAAAVQVAQLQVGLTLSSADFFVTDTLTSAPRPSSSTALIDGSSFWQGQIEPAADVSVLAI